MLLLEPHRGTNVGAVCRAMKNMGAGELYISGGDYDADEARRTAVHAADLFDRRISAGSFEEAVASCSLVIGTTSRSKPWSIPVLPIGEVLAAARERGLEPQQIALVFGPEDHGLSNEELARCHRLAFIPTAGDYESLNLGQAVLVCLYEWLRGAGHVAGEETSGSADEASASVQSASAASVAAQAATAAPADARAQAAAMADLEKVLGEIGFLDGDQGERVMASVASIFLRSGLDEREVSILRGMARQIRWAARTKPLPGEDA